MVVIRSDVPGGADPRPVFGPPAPGQPLTRSTAGDNRPSGTPTIDEFRRAIENLPAAGDNPLDEGPPPRVWLGFDPPWGGNQRLPDRETPGYTPAKEARVADLPDAQRMVYEWYGTEEYDKWGDFLFENGWVKEGEKRDFDKLDEWWQYAVEKSAQFYSINRTVSPWQFLSGAAGGEAGRGGGGGGGGGGPRTVTSTSVNLTDPDTARAIVNRALSDRLGRAANEEEISSFLNVLNSAERSSPTVTTTNYSGDGSRVSSTTTGGIGAAGADQLAVDEALENPEYGAYQAASTYFNALIQALGSTV